MAKRVFKRPKDNKIQDIKDCNYCFWNRHIPLGEPKKKVKQDGKIELGLPSLMSKLQ